MSEKQSEVKLVLANPLEALTKTVALNPQQVRAFLGKKIGEEIDASVIGMSGQKIRITGGSYDDGFPMRPDITGARKADILLSGGVGFHPKRKPHSKRKKKRNRRRLPGLRKRVTLRGNTIGENIAQINAVILKPPEKKSESGAGGQSER